MKIVYSKHKHQLPKRLIYEVGMALLALVTWIAFHFFDTIPTGINFFVDFRPSFQKFQISQNFNLINKVWGLITYMLLYKAAHLFYIIDLIRKQNCQQQNRKQLIKLKIIFIVVLVISFLALDICLTLFNFGTLYQYYDYMFVSLHILLSALLLLIFSILLFKKKISSFQIIWWNLFYSTVPIILYYSIYALQWLALPLLYERIANSFANAYGNIIFAYIFPFIELILQALVRLCIRFSKPGCSQFIRQFYFILIGYRFGLLLHYQYTEAEFYYLLLFPVIKEILFSFDFIFKHKLNKKEQQRGNIGLIAWGGFFLILLYLNYSPFYQVFGDRFIYINETNLTSNINLTKIQLNKKINQSYLVPWEGKSQFGQRNRETYFLVSLFIAWLFWSVNQKYIIVIEAFSYFYYMFGGYIFLQAFYSAFNFGNSNLSLEFTKL